MNEQPLDPGLRALFAMGPGAAPAATVDRALAKARTIPQRRPRFAGLDARAWPPRPRTLSDPAVRRSARLALVVAVGLLLVAGVVAVGARLLEARPPEVTLTSAGAIRSVVHNPIAFPLADGRLLIVGMSGEQQNATFFDPRTGQSSELLVRAFATAIGPALPLPDGRIVVSGKVSATEDVGSSVGILDPATGAVTIVGQMTIDRFSEAQVVLADGRVLISGGLDLGDRTAPVPVASVEVFDPETGTFTSLAPLLQPRLRHSMLLLDDGRVLVVGGSGTLADVLEVEVYDPATGRSTVVGTINPGRSLRAGPAVGLGDGRALIPGGAIPDPPCGANQNYRQATFIFDPDGDKLVAGPELPHFVGQAVALGDGRAVVFGRRLVTPGGCSGGVDAYLDPWLGVIDPAHGVVYQSRDPLSGVGTLALDIDRDYAAGALLADGRVALVTDAPDGRMPNPVDILTIGD